MVAMVAVPRVGMVSVVPLALATDQVIGCGATMTEPLLRTATYFTVLAVRPESELYVL